MVSLLVCAFILVAFPILASASRPGTLDGNPYQLHTPVPISFEFLPDYNTRNATPLSNLTAYSADEQANINAAHTLAFRFDTKGFHVPLIVANFTGIKLWMDGQVATNGQLCNSTYYCNDLSNGSDLTLFNQNFTYIATVDTNIVRTDDIVIFRLQFQDVPGGANNGVVDNYQYAWNTIVYNAAVNVPYSAIVFHAVELRATHRVVKRLF